MFPNVRKWTRRKHLTRWYLFRRLAPTVLAIFVCVVLYLERRVHGVSRISAQSELVSYIVINPEVVEIPVRGVRISNGPPQISGKCVSGYLNPVLNTTVAYGRAGWGPLIVRVGFADHRTASTAAFFTAWGQGQRITLSAPVELVFDSNCKLPDGDDEDVDLSKTPVPYSLPVFGRATIGSESHPAPADYPEPATLITAKVTVSARSALGALYEVDTFDLPVGSRVDARLDAGGRRTAARDGVLDDAAAGANWAGIAYLDPSKPGLSVEVETDTTTLRIVRPNSATPDIVKVTGLREVFEDPSLLIVYKSIFVLGVVLTFCGWAEENLFDASNEEKQLRVLEEIKKCLQKSGD